MKTEATPLQGCFIIHDHFFEDARGYFFESFNRRTFALQTGMDINFVQDNQSSSSRGVLRGLHFQSGDFAQAKLVRVLEGAVLDVVVDIRKNSPTFGQHFSIELSDTSQTQLFIPRGFAHGFLVLSKKAVFFYKCDNYYNREAESGIMYNDPALNINWKFSQSELILSQKDQHNPLLKDIMDSL